MKLMIFIGATAGGLLGGWIGSLFDGGLGLWSLLLSTIGSLVGIWLGYKIGKNYF
ncbi:MAG TPA: hypothetical protein VN778_03125 [Verrucomicrobiae bacterium]|nr:hypothetical protein [Verrucomicrobiae bacterium]